MECRQGADLKRLRFEFYESWMSQYEFWTIDTDREIPKIGLLGSNFDSDLDVLLTVQLRDSRGNCIFEVRTAALQALGLETYFKMFGAPLIGISPAGQEALAKIRGQDGQLELGEALYIELFLPASGDAIEAVSVAVVNGEIFQ